MAALQAAVLRVKLKHLDRWVEKRRAHAESYGSMLEDVGVETPQEMPYGKAAYHLYVVRYALQEALAEFLRSKQVGVGFHYPIPLHLQPALKGLGYREGDFPVAERLASRVLSLPMYPELETGQISYVCDMVREATELMPKAAAEETRSRAKA
jgi:dTDP-4-amino-4,6-dideoxygalactose transaminase